MKTLADLLRAADPLANEPLQTVQERLRTRQRVLASRRGDAELPQRRIAILAVAAFAIVGVTGFAFWSRFVVNAAPIGLEMRLAEYNPAGGLRPSGIAGSSQTIYLHEDAIAANSDIASAEVIPGAAASIFNVAITFTAEGAAKMMRASRTHIGKPLAILVDGQVIAAPVVRSAVSTSAVITGNFSRTEAERLAAGILRR